MLAFLRRNTPRKIYKRANATVDAYQTEWNTTLYRHPTNYNWKDAVLRLRSMNPKAISENRAYKKRKRAQW